MQPKYRVMYVYRNREKARRWRTRHPGAPAIIRKCVRRRHLIELVNGALVEEVRDDGARRAGSNATGDSGANRLERAALNRVRNIHVEDASLGVNQKVGAPVMQC